MTEPTPGSLGPSEHECYVQRMPFRLAADIGGTFTDIVLESVGSGEGDQWTSKVLTTHDAPADGVLIGIDDVLNQAGADPGDVDLVVHGTTLATNALIERRGARTALLVTEGFRDSVAMAQENRFEQYDLFMERPEPLVPRHLCLPITERLSAAGDVLIPLDERTVHRAAQTIESHGVTSVAIGFLHSYVDSCHEERAAELLTSALPALSITLSSRVCPEIREYERLSTASANAYVQPLMATYLSDLAQRLEARGVQAPLLLMLSNGGLATLDTAISSPIGLVESGPAGGALLAERLAAELGAKDLLSFDMGGTTAKLCLLTDGAPSTSREFEVARVYRFLKGSGLPLRIPVIDLVEIGAGGGSIASVDGLGRIAVGPESAGSEPGPAAYDRGGQRPTVTDADVHAGRVAPAWFAGGELPLVPSAAADTLADGVAGPLGLELDDAAVGVGEVVTEHMANAARVHAVERGRDLDGGVMVAFGGAAPLHAARLAERLGAHTVVVPVGAGVGSAIGFLRAPVSYEVVRTSYQRLDRFDAEAVNATLKLLRAEATGVVRSAVGDGPFEDQAIDETIHASMRYRGQGHEIDVLVPVQEFGPTDHDLLLEAFNSTYRSLYTRLIPGMVAEVMTWRLRVTTRVEGPRPVPVPATRQLEATTRHRVLDPIEGWIEAGLFARDDLHPGDVIEGPALVTEAQTTTVVSPRFDARVDPRGHLILERNDTDTSGNHTNGRSS